MILIQILLYILLGQIQLKYGGSFSALKEEPLHDWLKKQNPRLAFTVSSLLNGHQLCSILLCHFTLSLQLRDQFSPLTVFTSYCQDTATGN